MYDLIIIGLGPAGINASIYAKRSNLKTLVIEKKMPGGTLHGIKDVDNYLGYNQITGPELAIKFYRQFKELNLPFVTEEVIDIIVKDNIKTIITNNNKYQSKAVIIATGRGPLKLGLRNEELPGISYCVLCDGALYNKKLVAIYGNGNQVLEEAIYLSDIANKVYLIANRELIGTEELKNKVKNIENMEIIENEGIVEIEGTQKLEKIKLKKQELIIEGLFINNKYGPITYFCKNLDITDANGYIKVNEKQETSIPGIFACGDNTRKDIYQIITAASEGASSAINAYKYIKNI